MGARLVRELQGYPCTGLHPSEDGSLGRKSLTCSRTFGRPLTALADVRAAVAAFTSRAAEKLRRQGDQACMLTVFVQKSRFDSRVPPPYSRAAKLPLPTGPSADTRVVSRYATHLLTCLWEPGTVYHKAGVVLDGLEPPSSGQQLGLFKAAPLARTQPAPVVVGERPHLMAALDHRNQRYGRGTVRLGAAVPAGTRPPWQGQGQGQSGAFTTRLEDLLTVD